MFFKKGEFDVKTLDVARTFNWTRGLTRVHVQQSHVGIRGQWIDSWRPRADSTEVGLILEDDISVSPFVYRWLKAVHRQYDKRGNPFNEKLFTRASRSVLTAESRVWPSWMLWGFIKRLTLIW